MIRPVFLALLLPPGAAAFPAGAQDPATEVARLDALDSRALDGFGGSVAVSGDAVLVGANDDDHAGVFDAGSAYVFRRRGAAWSQEAKLVAPAPSSGAWFGFAVALEGDLAAVGCPRDDHEGGLDAGSVYLFERTGTTWTLSARLVAGDPARREDFGRALALQRGRLVVGAPWSTEAGVVIAGSVHVFERSGSSWTETAKLVPTDGSVPRELGHAVALDGDVLVAGARDSDVAGHAKAGAAYVFEHDATGWTQNRRLLAFDGWTGHEFGSSVAVSGSTLAVGAPGFENSPLANKGAVYLFERGRTTWKQAGRLEASDREQGSQLGRAVALEGDLLVAGAWFDPRPAFAAGSAYVFARRGGLWAEHTKLVASAADAGDYFGGAVALSGSTLLVGAHGTDRLPELAVGSVHVFCSSLARATARNAGRNPPSLRANAPVIGELFTATVDLTTTGHDFAWLVGFAGPGETLLPGGQALLWSDPDARGELLGFPIQAGPVAVFQTIVPRIPSLCGLSLTTQAVHLGGVRPFALSNAQDLVVGSF